MLFAWIIQDKLQLSAISPFFSVKNVQTLAEQCALMCKCVPSVNVLEIQTQRWAKSQVSTIWQIYLNFTFTQVNLLKLTFLIGVL